jgi:hypothetical protein
MFHINWHTAHISSLKSDVSRNFQNCSEKVTVPYTKPNIILQGAGRLSTIISWNARASSYGTADSATFSVTANNFVARGIGFKVYACISELYLYE